MSKLGKIIVGVATILFYVGCGVKGDPKPPLTPAALGHGQPSFKRATKEFVPKQTQEIDPSSGTPVDEGAEPE